MNSSTSYSNKRKSYKAFLEPEFTALKVNRRTYNRWMKHVKEGILYFAYKINIYFLYLFYGKRTLQM